MKQKTYILYILITISLFACKGEETAIVSFSGTAADLTLSQLTVSNNQIILNGTGLTRVSQLRITNSDGFDETFLIETASGSTLKANSTRQVTFYINSTYNVIVYDSISKDSLTYLTSFAVQDGTITASKLSTLGAGNGQVLRYNGTSWIADDFNGLIYAGTWDANTNIPNLSGGGESGEYYIVNTAGSTDLFGGFGTDVWEINDWAIWNNNLTRWEKIDNTTPSVQSFAGRNGAVTPGAGDYTWDQIDKTTSSLSDIADVDTTGIIVGQLLKWDGTKWIASNDENSPIIPTSPLNSTSGPTSTFGIAQADASTSGFITSVDWNTFNGKMNAITTGTSSQYYKGDLSLGTFENEVLNATIAGFISAAGVVSTSSTILEAISKLDGNINSKEALTTKGDLSETASNVLTFTNGSNAVLGAGTSIEVSSADATYSGYLTSSDWNNFNNKLDLIDIDNITIELNVDNKIGIKDKSISSIKRITTVETKSGDYTINIDDNNKIFLVSGNSTITLPSASVADNGFFVTIKNIDSSSSVIVDAYGLETIEGSEKISLTNQLSFISIISDGTSWFTVNQNSAVSTVQCPTGFIPIQGNSFIGTENFCVMKYEAKNSSNTPVSQGTGSPWTNITATNAQAECESITETGYTGSFSLISNSEWITIARDIESVDSNWSGGSKGIGNLARGWSANSSSDVFQNNAVATANDSTCLYNVETNTCGTTGTHELRRTHILSNGSEIWDISGNVWEWVDWNLSSLGFNTAPVDEIDSGWSELDSLTGILTSKDIMSASGYTSLQQAGRWQDGLTGAPMRGGSWDDGNNAGIFALSLNGSTTQAETYIGFRCVYRP